MPGPRLGMKRAESGQLSYCVRPTRREPAPRAKRISVVVGLSETIRVTVGGRRMESPKWSTPKLRVRGVAWSRAQPKSADTKSAAANGADAKDADTNGAAANFANATGTPPRSTGLWRERGSSPGSGPITPPAFPTSAGQWLWRYYSPVH